MLDLSRMGFDRSNKEPSKRLGLSIDREWGSINQTESKLNRSNHSGSIE